MARTVLNPKEIEGKSKVNLGNIIIFCEGNSEKYYIDYFKEIINNNDNKYTNVHVETEVANSDARAVLNFAEEFLAKEENNRKYQHYGKYLLFDCDAPKDIQDVILDMLASDNNYTLLLSNFRFEIWFLMYFEDLENIVKKRDINKRLSYYLRHEYKKADKGIIREIISKGDINKAIKNAYELEKSYRRNNKNIRNHIEDMNPYTTVHRLMEQIMLEISN